MAIPYVVRKKIDITSGEKKELWYAVAKSTPKKGGMTEEDIARRVSERTGFSRGVVEGILTEVFEAIEFSLGLGFSVNLKNMGSFQTAVTSKGFDNPDDVTPNEVKLSRIYFVADRKLTQRIRKEGYFREK